MIILLITCSYVQNSYTKNLNIETTLNMHLLTHDPLLLCVVRSDEQVDQVSDLIKPL